MWQLDLLVHSNCTLILFLWNLVHSLCFYCFQTNQQQLTKFQKVHQKLTEENNYRNTPKFPWGNPFSFSLLDGVLPILLKIAVITKNKIPSFGKVTCDHTARNKVLQIKKKIHEIFRIFSKAASPCMGLTSTDFSRKGK